MRLPPQRFFSSCRRYVRGTDERTEAEADTAKPLDRARRILLVEDEYLIAIELEQWLLDIGHEVTGIACSAEDAIAAAVGSRPDLIIMDVRLAGDSDGIDAAKEILAQTSIRSLFASAHSDSRTRSRAVTAQPLGWLTKPYSQTDLLEALDTAFGMIES